MLGRKMFAILGVLVVLGALSGVGATTIYHSKSRGSSSTAQYAEVAPCVYVGTGQGYDIFGTSSVIFGGIEAGVSAKFFTIPKYRPPFEASITHSWNSIGTADVVLVECGPLSCSFTGPYYEGLPEADTTVYGVWLDAALKATALVQSPVGPASERV